MLQGLFQPMHLLVILVIVLVIFGPRRLPEIGSAVGKSLREFRKGTHDLTKDFSDAVDEVKQPIEDLTMHKRDARPAAVAASTSAGEGGRVCPKCSAGNASTSKFCGGCGAQIA